MNERRGNGYFMSREDRVVLESNPDIEVTDGLGQHIHLLLRPGGEGAPAHVVHGLISRGEEVLKEVSGGGTTPADAIRAVVGIDVFNRVRDQGKITVTTLSGPVFE